MKRTFLAKAVALPVLIAMVLHCSYDTAGTGPKSSGSGGGGPTTTTAGGGNQTTTTGGGNGGATTGGGTGGATTGGGTGGATTGGGNGGATTDGGGSGGHGGATTDGGHDGATTDGSNGGSGGSAGSGGTAGASGAGGRGGMAGVGGMAGAGGMDGGGSAPCTPQGDCTGVLKTRSGLPMDGWANIDTPRQSSPPDGVEGDSQVDNAAPAVGDQTCGSPCAGTEGRADHGLPLKWASWQLMGPGIDMGTMYRVTLHFWGVIECKTYLASSLTNCTRPANAGRAAKYDMWCPGATDPSTEADHYNTYVISVTPQRSGTTPNLGPNQGPQPAAGNWWMMNECPAGESESHKTWMIDYEKTINVPAGSWINFLDFDSNCLAIQNCGTSNDAAGACTMHYSNAPSGAVPAPPTSISNQPAAAGAGTFGQWIYFDVKSVVPM